MKKKWMSRTLALALAGTTVASMVPTVPVNAKECCDRNNLLR